MWWSLAIVATLFAIAPAASAAAMGSISGTVHNQNDKVCVLVLDAHGQALATAATRDDGSYSVTGVPAGSWTVEYSPDGGCFGFDNDQALQYYKAAATPYTATPVTATAGAETPNIDVTLAAAAKLDGQVSDSAGKALSAVCVVLEDTSGRPVLRRLTNDQGEYSLTQLPAGTFLVQFVDDGCIGTPPAHVTQWNGGAASAAAATPITLAAGQTVGQVDATLADAPKPPAGGSGTNSGSGPAPSQGPVALSVNSPGSKRPAERVTLRLAPARGRVFGVDAHGHLTLRVTCSAAAATCRGRVAVARLDAHGHAHRLLLRSVALSGGFGKTFTVTLRRMVKRVRFTLWAAGHARPVFVETTLVHRSAPGRHTAAHTHR